MDVEAVAVEGAGLLQLSQGAAGVPGGGGWGFRSLRVFGCPGGADVALVHHSSQTQSGRAG